MFVPILARAPPVSCYRHVFRYVRAGLESLVETFGAETRDRRKALRLTQDELAELSGCSPRFVRALEAGKRTVRLDKLAAVLDALGLELATRLRVPD